jgi:oxygen-independent coproporphyrinogen-3 oxidase
MVVITKKREVAARYLDYLHREVALLAHALGERRRVVQHHWGGGTPTYLDVEQIEALAAVVRRHFDVEKGAEVAIEVDPRVTTDEQLERLRAIGFNRLSLGVQDLDPTVQEAVNRIQGEDLTRRLFERARALGFESINVDLIYGLPFQTREGFARTVAAIAAMRPDRLAVYSYAHVPWIRGNQRRIDPKDLPPPSQKLELFLAATESFLDAGYRPIGMDHFALPGDELATAAAAGRLHRNFMGYTTKPATDMVGAGVSAIGDVSGAFAQNTKKLSTYYATLDRERFPVERGYPLDDDDRVRRFVITELMCNLGLDVPVVERRFGIDFRHYFETELRELAAEGGLVADGLVEVRPDRVQVTARGRLLVRNVCMTFDRYLRGKTADRPVFSRTV